MSPTRQYEPLNPCPACGTSDLEVRAVWQINGAVRRLDLNPPVPTGRIAPSLLGVVVCKNTANCPLAVHEVYADVRSTGVK